RKQFLVTLIGVAVGALLVAPAYALIVKAYGLGSEALPAPFASMWKAVALVATQGGSALPPHAGRAAEIAFGAGVAPSLLGRPAIRRFVPSPLALGIGFILPASASLAMLVGALGLVVARRFAPQRAEDYANAIGGGAIAGESIMGVIIGVLQIF